MDQFYLFQEFPVLILLQIPTVNTIDLISKRTSICNTVSYINVNETQRISSFRIKMAIKNVENVVFCKDVYIAPFVLKHINDRILWVANYERHTSLRLQNCYTKFIFSENHLESFKWAFLTWIWSMIAILLIYTTMYRMKSSAIIRSVLSRQFQNLSKNTTERGSRASLSHLNRDWSTLTANMVEGSIS